MAVSKSNESTFFNKDNSLSLKGILCVVVLLHHLYQFTAYFFGTPVGFLLNMFGEWGVAVFLFISGYGLMISYREKGTGYLNGFLKKRFLPLYLKYLFFVVIYIIFDFSSIKSYRILLTSVTWGNTIVSFGWFFPMIFALYLGFYFSFRLFKTEKIKYSVFCIFIIAYMFSAYHFQQRHVPVIAFAFGCFVAIYKQVFSRLISKYSVLILVGTFSIFFGYYALYVFSRWSNRLSVNNILYDSCAALSYMAVSLFAITLTELCSSKGIPLIHNRITGWLGTISLEVYALQGLILRFFIKYIENRLLYVFISVTIIIAASFVLNSINKRVMNLLSKSQ